VATIIEGTRQGDHNARIGIVVSRFNAPVTERLLAGAVDNLKSLGVADENVVIVWVPGAVEIPLAAQKLAQSGAVEAIVTLGAVIRGETSHYDYVCSQAAAGVARVSLDSGLPVIFGILTTETEQQAFDRAGVNGQDNKGAEAALAALEMISVGKALSLLRSRPSRAK